MQTNYKIIKITAIFLICMGAIAAILIKMSMFEASLLSPALHLWSTAIAAMIFLACLLSAILLFLVISFLEMTEEYINDKKEERENVF